MRRAPAEPGCGDVAGRAGGNIEARSFLMAASADCHLLFGLIALQVGLINQAQLVAAFQAWARDKARPLADYLADQAGLELDGRAAVEAMVGVHLRKNREDTEKSLAAIPADRSIRERLAALGDPDLTGTLVHIASGPSDSDSDLTTTCVGTSTSDGQRFRILRPYAAAVWAPSTWRSIAS